MSIQGKKKTFFFFFYLFNSLIELPKIMAVRSLYTLIKGWFELTISMADLFCGLDGYSDNNTSYHEHVVDLRNVNLTPVLSGGMNNFNP